MIGFDVPTLAEYDTSHTRQLISQIEGLHSFGDVALWKAQVTEALQSIRAAIKATDLRLQQTDRDIQQVKSNRQDKPVLARLFSGRQEEKRFLAEKSRLTHENSQLQELVDQIEAAIDLAPDSPEDLKNLLKECWQRKKELQIRKKAANAEMRVISVEARQQTATTVAGKYGQGNRRRIRLAKEKALEPYEEEKATLDRQMIKLEQTMTWLERFK